MIDECRNLLTSENLHWLWARLEPRSFTDSMAVATTALNHCATWTEDKLFGQYLYFDLFTEPILARNSRISKIPKSMLSGILVVGPQILKNNYHGLKMLARRQHSLQKTF